MLPYKEHQHSQKEDNDQDSHWRGFLGWWTPKSFHQQLKIAHKLKTKAHNQTANKKILTGCVIAGDLFYDIET